MKKKIFIFIYTFAIILSVSLLYVVVTTIGNTPAVPPTQQEAADVSIGQYPNRQNANTIPQKVSKNIPILGVILPNSNPPASGCALHFSIVPSRKAIGPNGMITYALTLLNQGSETCQNVSVSLYYTNREHFVSSNPSPTASDYYWSIGDMSPNKSQKIEVVTQAAAGDGDQIISDACATADNSKDICPSNVIFVKAGASAGSLTTNTILVQKVTGAIWGSIFSKKEFGIWVWDSPMKMTDSQASQVISLSKKNGFNVIYLTVDDYLPITQLSDSTGRADKENAYMKSLSTFITAAHQSGIEVDAVGGDKDWAEPVNRWKGYALIDFVKRYNLTHPNALLRGLQYDVEPYLLSDYEANKDSELQNFVAFIDESATRMQSVPAHFSVVIPHFYDDVTDWTPRFAYKGKNAYAFTHLLDVLEKKSKSTIIVMSYRNFFDGDNGIKQISETEVSEATQGRYSTKIVIAQETGNVSPDYVTFYDYPKSSLFESLNEISTYFGKYSNFGGTAVHYFDSFLKLN